MTEPSIGLDETREGYRYSVDFDEGLVYIDNKPRVQSGKDWSMQAIVLPTQVLREIATPFL